MWVTYADGHLVFNDLMVPDAADVLVDASLSIRECGDFLGMPTYQVSAGQVQAPIAHPAPASTFLNPQPVALALPNVAPPQGVAAPSEPKGAPPPPKPSPPPLRQPPASPASVPPKPSRPVPVPAPAAVATVYPWPYPPEEDPVLGATGPADPAPAAATSTDDDWHDCADNSCTESCP